MNVYRQEVFVSVILHPLARLAHTGLTVRQSIQAPKPLAHSRDRERELTRTLTGFITMQRLLTHYRQTLRGLVWVAVALLCYEPVLAAHHLHEAGEPEEGCSLCGFSTSEPLLDCGGDTGEARIRLTANCARASLLLLAPRPFEIPLSRAPPIS